MSFHNRNLVPRLYSVYVQQMVRMEKLSGFALQFTSHSVVSGRAWLWVRQEKSPADPNEMKLEKERSLVMPFNPGQ